MLEGREWFGVAGASAEEIEQLKSVAPVELPDSYFQLLAYSNGGEGPLPVDPFNLCLDPIPQVIEGIQTGNFGQNEFAGFIVFGGNGGGEYLAFDTRGNEPWPVVYIDMVAGPDSAEMVTPTFDAFIELIGRE
ncbi:MAG TPA: SMI1/KNR4 family protein [Sphingomicrobium sp.]|nr:SMI1/KNR4 family protein [Sphingomicrobium sp.]